MKDVFLDFTEFLFMKVTKIKTLCYLTVPESPLLILCFELLSFLTEGFNLPSAVLLRR
jgi:hypothetical protein